MVNCNIQVMRNLFHTLSCALDFETGKNEGGVLTIRAGYDTDLDRMRYKIYKNC
jgi:hypothetical protein